jgi:hypothetical protein
VIALDPVVEIVHPPVLHRRCTPAFGLKLCVAAARAGFLSVLITRGRPACAVERSVLTRNLLAEVVFRLVAPWPRSPGPGAGEYGITPPHRHPGPARRQHHGNVTPSRA